MARKRKISLRNKNINEKIVQEYFEQNTNIIGLTDGILLDKEEIQSRSKRLNMLFKESDTKNCYVVGIKLGILDEDHIKKTIEYWNLSKKKYPKYEHCIIFCVGNITGEAMILLNSYDKQSQIIVCIINAFKYYDKPSPGLNNININEKIFFSCEIVSNNIKPKKK